MIPVFDLTRQNKILRRELLDIYSSIVEKGIFILGDSVERFEHAFARYIGVSFAVGVASGTDALTLSLLALGIGPGDEVILPANSYPSVFGISSLGVIPRLVDIDPLTYTIDPDKIEAAITKKTKAIIPVHLYGQAADMAKILEIAKTHKLPVIEDCAQAVGATISHQQSVFYKKVGSIGNLGCFSFYPTKNLGAFGDGGMVVTDNKDLYEKLKLYRMYGEKERYKSILVGRNSRLDELQAAILFCKLKYLDGWIERRREVAQMYTSKIQNPKSKIKLPTEVNYAKHTYHLYVISSKRRDQLQAYLKGKGIGTAIHYPTPIHLVPSFSFLGYKKGDFPKSEKACQEVLSLPMFPELTHLEVQEVVRVILQFCDTL